MTRARLHRSSPAQPSRSTLRIVPVELLLELERSLAVPVAEHALHRFAARGAIEDAHLRDLEVDRRAQLHVAESDGRERPAPVEALVTALACGEAEVRRAAGLSLRQHAAPRPCERSRRAAQRPR